MRDRGNPTSLSFRIKDGRSISYILSVTSDDDPRHITMPIDKSSYYRMFMEEESYREACYHCEYSTLDKPADITIGDYFEAKDDYPELFVPGGALDGVNYFNCLIVHSEKGRRLVSKHGDALNLVKADPRAIQASHKQLCRPGSFSSVRLRTIDAYKRSGICGVERVLMKDALLTGPMRAVRKPLLKLYKKMK